MARSIYIYALENTSGEIFAVCTVKYECAMIYRLHKHIVSGIWRYKDGRVSNRILMTEEELFA